MDEQQIEPGRDGHGQTVAPPVEHIAQRPSWLCRIDGQPWPCEQAKADILAEFAGMSPSLGVYLAGCWQSAMADLPDESPLMLYRRMLGWSRG